MVKIGVALNKVKLKNKGIMKMGSDSFLNAKTLQEALEIIESLPENQQEDLINIVKKRLTERRREVLADTIKDVREEYAKGKIKKGSVDDLLKDISQ